MGHMTKVSEPEHSTSQHGRHDELYFHSGSLAPGPAVVMQWQNPGGYWAHGRFVSQLRNFTLLYASKSA